MASEQEQQSDDKPEKFEITQVIKTYTDKVVKDISGNVY